MTTKTKGQETAASVSALLRARNSLLWVVTREEARVEGYLIEAAAAAGYVPRFWDIAQGVTDLSGNPTSIGGQDPVETLNAIQARAKRANRTSDGREIEQLRSVWIMRDLPAWLSGPAGAVPQRTLRNLARLLSGVPRENAQAIVVLTPSAEIPPELQGHATLVEFPMPDRAEIASILDVLIEQYELSDMLKNGTRDSAIDAAVGLTAEEAKACYACSLVQLKRIDPGAVAQEKKRVIAKEGLLEWYDPLPNGLDAVGGLDAVKAWMKSRVSHFSINARNYGLPAPRGLFIFGVSGCGKSLLCKAIATMLQCPLLRLDLNALKGKFVGQSESNLRRVIQVIESVGKVVVWIDEIEKALAGATSGSADGGVSADALGTILSWMQERRGEAFVVATANEVEALPPELLRKGRFDEVFFVDVPTTAERAAIVLATLRTYGRSADVVKSKDAAALMTATEGFTGAEIAALVPEALGAAFNDGAREITTDDLLAAARTVVPLTKTAAEKITKLREWARGRARPATTADSVVELKAVKAARRDLDLG
jgi:ATPase family associated with various cellular activities (AAA)